MTDTMTREEVCPYCKGKKGEYKVAGMSVIDTGSFEDYGGWTYYDPCWYCLGKGTVRAKPDAISTMLDELVKDDRK